MHASDDLAAELDRELRLADRLAAYAGRWVAVRDGDVVTDAGCLDELLEQVADVDVDGCFQVLTGPAFFSAGA